MIWSDDTLLLYIFFLLLYLQHHRKVKKDRKQKDTFNKTLILNGDIKSSAYVWSEIELRVWFEDWLVHKLHSQKKRKTDNLSHNKEIWKGAT